LRMIAEKVLYMIHCAVSAACVAQAMLELTVVSSVKRKTRCPVFGLNLTQ
jgi:hypothetical protein